MSVFGFRSGVIHLSFFQTQQRVYMAEVDGLSASELTALQMLADALVADPERAAELVNRFRRVKEEVKAPGDWSKDFEDALQDLERSVAPDATSRTKLARKDLHKIGQKLAQAQRAPSRALGHVLSQSVQAWID